MKLSLANKLLIGGAVFCALGFVFYATRKEKKTSVSNVLLLGGLDTRKNDKNITAQSQLLKEGLGNDYTIKAYRYTDGNGLKAQITKKSKVIVVLFSAGCSQADSVAKAMQENNQDLSNLYIVEPYAKSDRVINSVTSAIELGVPTKNVIVGKSKSVGKDIVDNATQTPECSPSHWCAITEVGKIIRNRTSYSSLEGGKKDEKIECNRCGWSWKVADGGNDLFVCHKCGNNNEPNK